MASNNQGGNKGGNKGNQGKQGKQGGSQQSGDTSNRGFASMDPQRQREIAAEGGRAAHASGNAHEFTSEEARRAGALSHGGGNQQSGGGGGQQSGGRGGNQGGNQGGNEASGGVQGGSPEQHAKAGSQSRKNEK
jgi:hypothetical protein